MAARAILSSRLAGLQVAARSGARRTYGAAAEAAVRKEPVNDVFGNGMPPMAVAAKQAPVAQDECTWTWMRDPKTGCWMPENHFEDVDAADLRARLLFSKNE